jgi:hypothetical protein
MMFNNTKHYFHLRCQLDADSCPFTLLNAQRTNGGIRKRFQPTHFEACFDTNTSISDQVSKIPIRLLCLFFSRGNRLWLTQLGRKQQSLTNGVGGHMRILLLTITTASESEMNQDPVPKDQLKSQTFGTGNPPALHAHSQIGPP